MNIYAITDDQGNVISTHKINTNLVPENSLLAIMNRRDVNKDGIVYTTDTNIKYVIWYLKTKPIVRDKLTEQVLTGWGVYDDYNAIWNKTRELMCTNLVLKRMR